MSLPGTRTGVGPEIKKLIQVWGDFRPDQMKLMATFTRERAGGPVSVQWESEEWRETITARGLPKNRVKLEDPGFWEALDQAFITSSTMRVVF